VDGEGSDGTSRLNEQLGYSRGERGAGIRYKTMKTKEFVSLAKQLSPDLHGFAINGPLMFIRPVNRVLRGLYFEGSSFDAKSFYLWAFFLPLCVPTKHVSFNLGKRIRGGGGERWSQTIPN